MSEEYFQQFLNVKPPRNTHDIFQHLVNRFAGNVIVRFQDIQESEMFLVVMMCVQVLLVAVVEFLLLVMEISVFFGWLCFCFSSYHKIITIDYKLN